METTKSIQVPPELHKVLKQLSVTEGKPIYEVIGARVGYSPSSAPIIYYNGFPVHSCKECNQPLDSTDTCQNKKCKLFLKAQ